VTKGLGNLTTDPFSTSRVRNCAFLVANATKNFALATRISQLVASGRLTTLFHARIITQTIALIFSQIDQNLNSKPPANWPLPFYLSVALKVSSRFTFIINLLQRFAATNSAKLRCYVFF